jgi:hypothetical protein
VESAWCCVWQDCLLTWRRVKSSRQVASDKPQNLESPLVVTAFPHWSHYKKIAKIAVVLADLGYPITFITGRIFQTETRSLHLNTTLYAIHGKADKMIAEDFDKLKTFKPGSPEEQLFIMQKSFIASMPDQHETLEHVFRDFSNRRGNTKPIVSMLDVVSPAPQFTGYM